MSTPAPPQIQAALDQLRRALHDTEGVAVDPLTAPWAEIEKVVIKLLGGAFDPRVPVHQNVAFAVGSALAERLRRDLGAFWFRNRAVPQGAALGFAPAVVVFSPFGAAMQALSRSQLTMLDQAASELAGVLGKARLSGQPSGGELGPEDYQRLFDPGFLQFVRLDPKKLDAALALTPSAAIRELDDAFGRLPREVPAEVREPLRQQIRGALKQLDAARPLGEQAARVQQLIELLSLLKAGSDGSGFAPVELWEEVLVPLLHIGAASTFPEVNEEEREAWKGAPEPVLVYVDALPFQVPAADEDGLLGFLPGESLSPVHPALASPESRLVGVGTEALRTPLDAFDPAAVRASVESFRQHVEAATGTPTPDERQPGQPGLLDVGLSLLGDLARLRRKVESDGGLLCLRYATESEAASEPLIDALRKALDGPRIILP